MRLEFGECHLKGMNIDELKETIKKQAPSRGGDDVLSFCCYIMHCVNSYL